MKNSLFVLIFLISYDAYSASAADLEAQLGPSHDEASLAITVPSEGLHPGDLDGRLVAFGAGKENAAFQNVCQILIPGKFMMFGAPVYETIAAGASATYIGQCGGHGYCLTDAHTIEAFCTKDDSGRLQLSFTLLIRADLKKGSRLVTVRRAWIHKDHTPGAREAGEFKENDIAVLELDSPLPLSGMRFAEPPEPGQTIFTVGYPMAAKTISFPDMRRRAFVQYTMGDSTFIARGKDATEGVTRYACWQSGESPPTTTRLEYLENPFLWKGACGGACLTKDGKLFALPQSFFYTELLGVNERFLSKLYKSQLAGILYSLGLMPRLNFKHYALTAPLILEPLFPWVDRTIAEAKAAPEEGAEEHPVYTVDLTAPAAAVGVVASVAVWAYFSGYGEYLINLCC